MAVNSPSNRTRVLGLLAKQPVAGQVKTRLAAQWSAEAAARLAEAFLLDTVERFAAINARRLLVFTPDAASGYFAEIARDRFELVPQPEGDLGERMASFFQQQLRAGVGAVVLVGTDSPTMPTEFIDCAFERLEHADLVIGPAMDGGYYLVGCARRPPPIFDAMAWSTHRVLLDTVQRLRAWDGTLALLPPWYDVDTLDDCRMLQGHLAALRQAGIDPKTPYTERLLRGEPP